MRCLQAFVFVIFTLPCINGDGAASDDDQCLLFPGLCDDTTPPSPEFDSQRALPALCDQQKQRLAELYKSGGTFWCYTTFGRNFLVYDPGKVSYRHAKIVNQHLPRNLKDLQQNWFNASFLYGNSRTSSPTGVNGTKWGVPPLLGFQVHTAGMAFINDGGGGGYGNNHGGAPSASSKGLARKCDGQQEEMLTCLSSAHALRTEERGDCSGRKISVAGELSEAVATGCDVVSRRAPSEGYIVRNRNLFALGKNHMSTWPSPGTNNYFYLISITGFSCHSIMNKENILTFLDRLANGWRAILDIWRLTPACSGRCELVTGAISSWCSFYAPTAVTLLCQLRAWGNVDVGSIQGCLGEQAVLKFGGMAVSDDGHVTCPPPNGGGACRSDTRLPHDWADRLTAGTNEDFADWLSQIDGQHCSHTQNPDGTVTKELQRIFELERKELRPGYGPLAPQRSSSSEFEMLL